jgi:hypothetical protein
MVSAWIPANGATRCHISSVINGIIGCAKRKIDSSTFNSVWRVPRCSAASSDCKEILDSSKYQSQYSFQVKS